MMFLRDPRVFVTAYFYLMFQTIEDRSYPSGHYEWITKDVKITKRAPTPKRMSNRLYLISTIVEESISSINKQTAISFKVAKTILSKA
jgi:hypothetical protein